MCNLEVDKSTILKKAEKYQIACYFVWLRRPDLPLDNPPRSKGEDIVIGVHIRNIPKLRKWFEKNGLIVPERQDYPFAPWGI